MSRAGPVHPDTFALVEAAISVAQNNGLNLAEVLNRAGLLATPDRDLRLRIETLGYVLARLEDYTPAEFVRRRNRRLETATLDDIYQSIVDWFSDTLDAVKRGEHDIVNLSTPTVHPRGKRRVVHGVQQVPKR